MDVKLPKLGEGAASGVVISLLVKEGDPVKEGQTILELENEKAVAPIPAPASGMVTKIRVKEGDKISVGQVILSIDTGGAETRLVSEPPAAERPKPAQEKPVVVESAEAHAPEDVFEAKSDEEIAAAPSLRRLARELGIDLRRVRGSERGGRIVMADLRAYVQRLQALASRPKADAGALAQAKAAPKEAVDFSRWGQITKQPLSQLRKVIAQRMSASWTTVPRVTQFDEADITAL